MANPTTQVQSHWSDHDDGSFFYWPLDPDTSSTYYAGELIGKNASGYATHFDDAGPLTFLGTVVGPRVKVDTSDTGLSWLVRLKRARYLTVPLATGTVGRAETNGAIGKKVYVQYSGACLLDPSSLTYANVLGRIVDIADAATQPGALTSTVAVVVETVPPKETGGVRFLAATGNQTINVADIGKTIFVPNTANLTLALPAVALAPTGGTLTFTKTTSNSNSIVTLDGNANETIHNATTNADMDAIGDSMTLINSGSAWWITAKNIA